MLTTDLPFKQRFIKLLKSVSITLTVFSALILGSIGVDYLLNHF
jgi:hypothetical protein